MSVAVSVILIALVAGAAYLLQVWAKLRPVRVQRRVPRVAIKDLKPGELVKVTGIVELEARALISPMTGLPCASYRLWAEQKTEETVTIIDDTKGTIFRLRDDTGVARIDGVLMDLTMCDYRTFKSPSPRELESFQSAMDILRYGKSLGLVASGAGLTIHEAVLSAGERIAVLGCVKTDAGHSELPVITSPDNGCLLVSDYPAALE